MIGNLGLCAQLESALVLFLTGCSQKQATVPSRAILLQDFSMEVETMGDFKVGVSVCVYCTKLLNQTMGISCLLSQQHLGPTSGYDSMEETT
jgi:hypothetical protein